ncbi:hypothetical protein ACN2XU_06660 [Primorskyibacter sp. 2E107]|uniref:hypothetical protein n=1 Tax=Primorskyibacter sp. 2E107 TaxID=3403458 RepID=UPI003AF5A286
MTDPFENAATCEEERAIATSLPREDLVAAVLSHSWDGCVASTMGTIADREDCPLLAVLFMFDLGEEYYAAPDVSGAQEIFDLFERIQRRINAGGYTHLPEDHLANDSPSVRNYLDTAANPIATWALSAKIVEPVLDRSAVSQRPLSNAEEQQAQEIFEAMKEAAPGGETAVKPIAMRAVIAGRRVEARIQELSVAQGKKRKPTKKWPFFVIWGVAIWLMWPSLQRMFFMQ